MRLAFFLAITIFVVVAVSGILKGFFNFLEKQGTGFEKSVFSLMSIGSQGTDKEVEELEKENEDLTNKLVEFESIKKENKALSDQFQTSSPSSYSLLPAHIISAPSFIPGVGSPQFFILDKGEKDGVKTAQAVVFKNNLVGKISKTSHNRSMVTLVTSKDFSLPARTLKTAAIGVIRGNEDELVFDNVELWETLEISDIVTTYGEADVDRVFIPPNIVIGKIISVERKPSSLFQSARVKSSLAFAKLFLVYVVIGDE